MELDKMDYALLTCLEEAETGLWKKELHAELERRATEFPGNVTRSIQTVGRRVEKLHEAAYIESCIVRPDNIPRELIIAYTTTEEGLEAVQEKRSALLKRYVAAYHDVIDEKLHEESNASQALAHLLCRHYNLEETNCGRLKDLPLPDLVAASHIFAARAIAFEEMDEQSGTQFTELMKNLDIPKEVTASI